MVTDNRYPFGGPARTALQRLDPTPGRALRRHDRADVGPGLRSVHRGTFQRMPSGVGLYCCPSSWTPLASRPGSPKRGRATIWSQSWSSICCLLYTSDAADEEDSVDL